MCSTQHTAGNPEATATNGYYRTINTENRNYKRDNALQIHPSLNFPASLSSLLREAINHQILLQARLRRRNQLKSNHTVHLLSQTSLRRVNWSQALKPNYLPSSGPKL
ncbi:uncharacterized protein LOC143245387 isoform X3 [Tachypleus tridentatus]|uniref:uncharacterized protein LOC143245387 isoform X3 n=1 Tax=Tachypleus tridentatus TaxID=6853 RepID=UPI003FCF2089